MSRIIVKNLPKNITAKKLETLFSSKGVITDLQLKYNKAGIFRQFAFVGFKTEAEAQAAKEYFNNTYVNTSKIQVDICKNLNDPNKPKAWKKQSDNIPSIDKSSKEDKEKEITPGKRKKENDEIPEDLKKDTKFKEFLEVNKDRKSKPVWAEDIDVPNESGSENEAAGSSSDSDYDTNYKKSFKDVSGDEASHKSEIRKISKSEAHPANENSYPTVEKSSPKKEKFDDSFTVKIKHLPYRCKKKQIKQFFHPSKIVSLRLPPKIKGIAYVKFKTEKDMKQALNKNKSYLDGRSVDVVKYIKKEIEISEANGNEQVKVESNKEENEELLAETGRIYVRNLCFSVTEKEIEQLFSKYGPIAEIHLPIDFVTKKAQGYAFVTFVFAEHAVKAFTELDGTIFQGRLLHLIPAKPKKEYSLDESDMTFKKRKELKMKILRESSHNWNILFLGMNAVADIIAEKYSVEKSKLLLGEDSKESIAVRMALSETQMVMENRNFLIQNGVQLDAFSQAAGERSKTVIVVKHLPAKTKETELRELFSKHGELERVVLPPSGLLALIEFKNPTEAKTAFRKLAYSRFHNLPLYLEWAPVDGLKAPLPSLNQAKVSEETTENEGEKQDETTEEDRLREQNVKAENAKAETDLPSVVNDESEPSPGTTIFVKNINFDTAQKNFEKHFKQCGPIHYAVISTKTDVKTGKCLSMGFGFVQFKDKESALKAIQNLQHARLDGHSLELKIANREIKPVSSTKRKKYEIKKQLSAKILIRNIPFEASEKEIKELFQQFGMTKFIRLPKKLDGSGEHRGFGFVEYYTKDNAARAFNSLCHSTHLFGRRLVLEWANPDSEDVEELRKKTASRYLETEPKKNLKRRKLNEEIVLAAEKHGEDDDD